MGEYRTIKELTCDIFDKIHETGDTSLLGVQDHEKAWDKIEHEFIDTFGVNKEYLLYLNKMSQYVRYLNQAVNGSDKSAINFANYCRMEAEEMTNRGESDNISIYAIVAKYMGFRIDPKEVTVFEFYGYLKLLEHGEENKV